jgi:hypothetical protein
LRDLYKRNESVIGSQLGVGQRVMLRDVDATVPQTDVNGGETTAEKASKHHSFLNNGGFSEHPLPVFTREDTDKNNPSGELPAIIPKSYNRTGSAPPSPMHPAAPAQDAYIPSTSAPMMMMPENAENHHNIIYTEPTLTRKLAPIKPAKMPAPVPAPAVKKVIPPNVTTYVPSKSQPKGAVKPYYLHESTQKSIDSYHYVRTGETLFGISRKYGTDVDTLKRLNGKTDNVIVEGQRLRVK